MEEKDKVPKDENKAQEYYNMAYKKYGKLDAEKKIKK